MGWNCSAHVSFRNGLELLRPCFISQWAGITPPMFHFAMGWYCSAHVLSCWCSTGLLFLCLMSCWWLDSIFLSSVLLVLDGTFVSLFNVVLVARLDFFILGDWILQPIYRGIGFSNPFWVLQWIGFSNPFWIALPMFHYSYWLQPCVFMFCYSGSQSSKEGAIQNERCWESKDK